MTDDRSLERAARSWIEAGPTRAPERAVEAALLQIHRTNQERGPRVPWRFPAMTTPYRVAVLIAAGALVLAGLGLLGGVGSPRHQTVAPTPAPSSTPGPSATAAAAQDYSTLNGTILMEHLGNAPDRSEMSTTDYHPERRRLYFMDPAEMTGATARELMPGQPPSGKLSADVSPDGRQVVFMDTADPARIWIANRDGTGLRQVTTDCACGEMDPAFDPTGTKIAFVHVEGAYRLGKNGAKGYIDVRPGPSISWLGIRDLATGSVTKLDQTVGSSTNALPEQPTWSPDGTRIAFNRITWGPDEPPESGVLQIVDVSNGIVDEVPLGGMVPGDADWSPDGSTILFTHMPLLTTASIAGIESRVYAVGPDGSGLKMLTSSWSGGATWMPDGHILFNDYNQSFSIMQADGTDSRPVNAKGDDLSDVAQGFLNLGHWIPGP